VARRAEPRRPAPVAAWIYRTATHLAVDKLRRSTRGAEVRGVEADVAAPAAPTEQRQELLRLASLLPADELELAFLTRVDGLTQPESAEVLGVSERTVRRMLGAVRARIAALGRVGSA